jgi:hypothetical protein
MTEFFIPAAFSGKNKDCYRVYGIINRVLEIRMFHETCFVNRGQKTTNRTVLI